MNSNQKKGKAKPSQTTTVKVTTSPNKKPQKSGGKPRKRTPTARGGLASDYVKTLNNPFEHTACQIGFGTMVGTKCGTAIFRSTVTANADGSLMFIGFPGADVLGYYSASAFATPKTYASWQPLIDSSSSDARAAFSSLRPISCGMRITPYASNNDKGSKGVLGLIPYSVERQGGSDYRVALTNLSTQNWYGSHMLNRFNIGSGGHESFETLWRPQDLDNYIFTRDYLQFNTVGATVVFPECGPVMIAAISGPPSLQYDVEIVCRYEGLPNMGGLFAGDKPSTRHADYYSIDHLWNTVVPHLTFEAAKTTATYAKIAWDAWSLRSTPTLKAISAPADNFIVVEQKDAEEKKVA